MQEQTIGHTFRLTILEHIEKHVTGKETEMELAPLRKDVRVWAMYG